MGEEQQEAFEEIKRRLVKAPVLHMPNCEGRFQFYTPTLVSLQQVELCMKFKMVSQTNSICK